MEKSRTSFQKMEVCYTEKLLASFAFRIREIIVTKFQEKLCPVGLIQHI